MSRLEVEGFYADERASVPDPVAFARHQAALKPLRDFRDRIARSADAWLSRRERPSSCTLSTLRDWAERRALSGASGTNEEVYAKTRLIFAAAVAVANLRDALGEDLLDLTRDWLDRLARQNIEEFPKHHPSRGDPYLWTGAMAAAVHRLTGTSRFSDYASRVLDYADHSLQPDGTFPPAMERGQRATIYHVSALDAVIFMRALLGADPGAVELSDAERKLLDRAMAGVRDPAVDRAVTHVEQEPVERRALGPVGAVDGSAAANIDASYLFGGDPKLWLGRAGREGGKRPDE